MNLELTASQMLGCSSFVECLPSIYEALGLIPSTNPQTPSLSVHYVFFSSHPMINKICIYGLVKMKYILYLCV
jgi:hypothetical protein